MASKDIIVIGASAGGVEALTRLIQGLPKDLPAALLIVLHTPPHGSGMLPDILSRAGPLATADVTNGGPIKRGRIYVAPPDHHLLLEGTKTEARLIRISRGPKENRFRPSIDALFRSAAYAAGPRVIGVVLTGLMDDGTAGLWAIKDRGGTSVVQDPQDALNSSMPRSALAQVEVDHCVPLIKMSKLLTRLAREPALDRPSKEESERMKREVEIAIGLSSPKQGVELVGEPSLYVCPECHAMLAQIKEGNIIRFRCHTGHAYSLESLQAEMGQRTEEGLWNVMRSIQESILLLENRASQLGGRADAKTAQAMRHTIANLKRRGEAVRQLAISEPRPIRTKGEDKAGS